MSSTFTSERARLAIILATVLIDMLGIGLMWPVLPMLIRELSSGDIASASSVYGWLVALYSLMQFGFGPAMGALSDRFGRRPILLISLIGLSLDYVILALAPNLWWVAGARIVGGVLGASITTASAYIADITPPERRAQNFGLIGVAFGIGFVAGPFIGGILAGIDVRAPFYAAAIAALVAAAFAYFLLPESLARENRKRFRLSEANPVGAFIVLGKYPIVIALMVVLVAANLGERMVESVWVLYFEYRYMWGPVAIGISLATFGIVLAIVQGGLVRVIVPWLGEVRTVAVGLAVAGLSLLLFGLATEGWMIYAILIPYLVGWGCAGPAIQALVTRAVPANEQGLLQGALNGVVTATGIVAPPVGAVLFAYFIGPDAPFHFPGVTFVLAAILYVVALAMMRSGAFKSAVVGQAEAVADPP